jgi:hypothetical protein
MVAILVLGVGGADVEKEQKKVEKAIREAAKRDDIGSAKVIYYGLDIDDAYCIYHCRMDAFSRSTFISFTIEPICLG